MRKKTENKKPKRTNKRKTKKIIGGGLLTPANISKIWELYNIITSNKDDETKEKKVIKMIDDNEELFTIPNLSVYGGNIMHLLAEGIIYVEKIDGKNVQHGCIEFPLFLTPFASPIKTFTEFLNKHPNVVERIRKTGALKQLNKEEVKRTPYQSAQDCNNTKMIETLERIKSSSSNNSKGSKGRKSE